jgi:AcrR family transcriptional regulator
MGTKKRKEREREARKNDILEAAKTVFFERGFQTFLARKNYMSLSS